ncbi:MAG: ABC transporter permease subunit [Planctomycetes bacterium]|jgi:peptide/nickel transport system permease protein|nr:ABC transporter permease subunit [Planctomycetota bacterium]
MLSYLLRRVLISLLVLFGLSVGVFGLVRLVPGDTAAALLGARYTEADAAALRQELGLDQPLVVQYGIWLRGAAVGDFGETIDGQPVAARIADALPVTLELMIIALGFAVVVGIPLGALAAVRRNRPTDHAAGFLGLMGLSVPGFWLGTLLILLFALVLGWLPSGGFVPITQDPVGNLAHMLLPGVALGLAVMAVVLRMTRASMLEVMPQAYVRAARARGLGRVSVVFRHALRNALIPVMTIIGIQAGYLLGGSVVIEEVFSLNGLGRLILYAINDRDYPLLQGAIMLVGTAFLAINLLVDIAYAWVDPRVRTGGEA